MSAGSRIATGVVVIAAALAVGAPALAEGRATASQAAPCSQSGLQAALSRGGTYDYRASCTLELTKTLTQSKGTVILDGDGHAVVLEGTSKLTGPAFDIRGGYFDLGNIEVEKVTAYGTSGSNGDPGSPGASGQGAGVANGAPGGEGGNGGDGGAVDGAAVSAAKGTSVSLDHDTFDTDVARGGYGGSGGEGGQGGQDAAGGGNGGKGGQGGEGGKGGNALGGAVYSAGTLTVIGGLFEHDDAIAGGGGPGGAGGFGGGGGGYGTTNPYAAGAGGTGGKGDKGGSAYGGAIYAAGPLTVEGTAFVDDDAIGGGGGPGLVGGPGGDTPSNGQLGPGGDGGDGGAAGDGGNGGGGAIDDLAKTSLAGLGFSGDKVAGAAAATHCPRSYFGCGGAGGAPGSGQSGGGAYLANPGSPGANGKPGTGTDPDFPSFNKNSGLPRMTVTTKSLPKATAGRPYRATLAGKGGIPPYSWKVTGLPRGLEASKAGVITGKPATAGTFRISVAVKDPTAAEQTTGKATLQLVVRRS